VNADCVRIIASQRKGDWFATMRYLSQFKSTSSFYSQSRS